MGAETEPGALERREVIETRGLTPEEAMALTRAVTQRYVRGLKRDPLYWAAVLASSIALGALVSLAVMLSYQFRCCEPNLFWISIVAACALVIGASFFQRRYFRFIAAANRESLPGGGRHAIDSAGYTIARHGQVTFLPWHRIADIETLPNLVLVATSRVTFWPIVTAAFAGQDVAGFCAELERRWSAARGASHAG